MNSVTSPTGRKTASSQIQSRVRDIQEATRGVTAQYPRSYILQCIKEDRFPDELWRELGKFGLLGLSIPEEHGGSGGGVLVRAATLSGVGSIQAKGGAGGSGKGQAGDSGGAEAGSSDVAATAAAPHAAQMQRGLLDSLNRSNVVIGNLVTTQLDAEDTLRMVGSAFGVRLKDLPKSEILMTLEAFFMINAASSAEPILTGLSDFAAAAAAPLPHHAASRARAPAAHTPRRADDAMEAGFWVGAPLVVGGAVLLITGRRACARWRRGSRHRAPAASASRA